MLFNEQPSMQKKLFCLYEIHCTKYFLFRDFFPFHVLSLSPSYLFGICFQGLVQLEICVNDLPSNVKVDWKVWGLVDSTCGENYHVLSISFKEIMTQYFVKQNIFSSIWCKELIERLLYERKILSVNYLLTSFWIVLLWKRIDEKIWMYVATIYVI